MFMKDIKIGIAYHKESLMISNECYLPIQVGKALHPQLDLGIQPDNEGDNISDRNDYYCELTALYWLWKNTKADYKGLCHYRRFFSYKTSYKFRFYNALKIVQSLRNHVFFNMPYVPYYNENNFREDTYRSLDVINSLLNKYEIISTTKVQANRGFYWHFFAYGMEIMECISSIIKDDYPSYYKYIRESEHLASFHFGNMSVMRNDLFEEYCSFIFEVLDKVENRLLAENWYKDLHWERSFSRKLGYFAEYLTNIFILKKKEEHFRIKRLDVAILA